MNQKNKGNRFEREIRLLFKKYYPHTNTTRLMSKALDDSGIDLTGLPYLIQCKNGYEKINFDYSKLYEKTKEELKKRFAPEELLHNYPYLIIHKKNGRKKQGITVTMTLEDFMVLIEKSVNEKNK